jgi:hypothetical protein
MLWVICPFEPKLVSIEPFAFRRANEVSVLAAVLPFDWPASRILPVDRRARS